MLSHRVRGAIEALVQRVVSDRPVDATDEDVVEVVVDEVLEDWPGQSSDDVRVLATILVAAGARRALNLRRTN